VTRPHHAKLLFGLAFAALLLAGCLPSVSPSGAQSGGPGASVPPRPATTTTTGAPVTTTVPAPTTTTAAPTPPASGGFVHPGVVLSRDDLDFVRAKIAAGEEPWKGAYDAILGGGSSESTAARPTRYRYSSLSYPPMPVPVIQSAGDSHTAYAAAHPELGWGNIGRDEHIDDAQAAYAQALLWYYTGNHAYADKAIEIMDAWSSTLREIKFAEPINPVDGLPQFEGGKTQAAWGGSLFARAGEIIRYSGAGWSAADVDRFESMLHDIYLPITITNWTNGANWMTTLAEATISIGVFTDDRAAFDAGIASWRSKVPSTIYMTSDGPLPVPPSPGYDTATEFYNLWYKPSSYVAGLHQEALRDISHMGMGLGAMSDGAQTAMIQGIDLWGEEQVRILAGYELAAGYVNQYLDKVDGGAALPAGWKPTGWVGATFSVGGEYYAGGWEVAYAHYAEDLGIAMPNTQRLVERVRPFGPGLHLSWQTLTNARS